MCDRMYVCISNFHEQRSGQWFTDICPTVQPFSTHFSASPRFCSFSTFFLPLYDSYYTSWFDSTGWTHNRQTFRHKIGIYLVCASDRRSDAREGNYFLEYFSTGTGMMACRGGDVQFQPKGQRQLCWWTGKTFEQLSRGFDEVWFGCDGKFSWEVAGFCRSEIRTEGKLNMLGTRMIGLGKVLRRVLDLIEKVFSMM